MLTITNDAADAIRMIIDNSDLSEGAGLRISATPTGDGEATLQLALSEAPAATDNVVQEAGAQVFLDPQVSTFLDDKTLGVEVAGEEVRFSIDEGPAPI